MAAKRRRYDNMDDILDKLLDSDCSDLDDDIELGDESDIDSDWEYKSEDERVLYGGGVGDADCGGGSSVVRNRNIEDSVCRDSIHECGGLVGSDDDNQNDNDDVDSGGNGDCLRDDDGGPKCLRGGVRVHDGVRGHGGVRVCGGCFCGVGGSGRCGGCVRVGGHGRCGVRVCGGVHDPGHGLGV